ncbi:class III extradiol dioxygenase family protein [Vibrio mangrovi]|uniref:Class III extradiol dioxygenase family protein n=1 Tax=Vibrio mangrovi TaxID=474394 RepID=A0A1Y6IY05_9VIBR|nr:class III extradiol dioxygenase family protein [Vibrio mangrovi]MDW6005240.1 class III extradiol dioxygenase family protein [Vibrio mangrovi]SMS02549.1 Protocatechuate 4,5-dioxygenase beta chain [Vibrio mangrovi]
MAKIIGGITSSHIPAIGMAMDRGLEDTDYWRDFFAGYPPVRDWMNKEQPDIAIIFYNDHGLEMFLDKKPTFALGCAPVYENADEGWGIATIPTVTGETELSWHIANTLIEDDFDPAICQEIKVDHGLTVPLSLMYPDKQYQHIKVIPVCINCERHPMPKPSRCYAFGQSIGRAVESFAGDQKVVVLGTGGLSHQLDGQRAGFINTDFDLECMDKLVDDPVALTRYTNDDLIEIAGAQGVELNMWIAMRGCLLGNVTEVHRNYVAPISNTGAGLQLLLNE